MKFHFGEAIFTELLLNRAISGGINYFHFSQCGQRGLEICTLKKVSAAFRFGDVEISLLASPRHRIFHQNAIPDP